MRMYSATCTHLFVELGELGVLRVLPDPARFSESCEGVLVWPAPERACIGQTTPAAARVRACEREITAHIYMYVYIYYVCT